MALPSLNENDKKDKKKENNNEVNKKSSLPSFDMPPLEEDYYEEDYKEDDGEFEEVTVDDVMNYKDDNKINEEVYEEVNSLTVRELPGVEIEAEEKILIDEDYNPDYEHDKAESEHKYIDKKKKRLLPLGGSKSKKKVKSSDFDNRKNILATTKILRVLMLLIIFGLFLFGLKNTFFPSHVYTETQIKSLALAGAGQTGFPEERGIAYVEDFMNSYLTIDSDSPELKEMLSFFYGEDSFASLSPQQLRFDKGNNAKQHVVIPPQVYESNLLTEYSALFKVSAYVSNSDGSETVGSQLSGRWLSFAVNVYYDKETEGLIITKDSPSIIPSYRILNQGAIPNEAAIGNGVVNTEILPALTPTINGFIKAYSESSISSHESILQYIDDKEDINLYDGFGGSVELNGAPSTAIKKVVYNSDDGLYRVDVNVDWVDKLASIDDKIITYNSRYIMRIKPIGEGKYLVTSFKPYSFVAQ